MVRPDRSHVELGEPTCCDLGADAARDLRLVVERQEGDDRERRGAPYRLDSDDELLEVEERLDHEQVDAASLEDLCLGGVERAVLGRVEHLELAERSDRPRDEDVAAGHLARLAGEADACRVDLLEGPVELYPLELAAVRPEGVRLDQLGAGSDVARVDGDDALGRSDVRLLGAAEAGHGLGDQRSRAAVGDERRAGAQAFEEAAHGSAMLVLRHGCPSRPRAAAKRRIAAASVAPMCPPVGAPRVRASPAPAASLDIRDGAGVARRASGEAGPAAGPRSDTNRLRTMDAGPPRARAASGERSGHRRAPGPGPSPLRGNPARGPGSGENGEGAAFAAPFSTPSAAEAIAVSSRPGVAPSIGRNPAGL